MTKVKKKIIKANKIEPIIQVILHMPLAEETTDLIAFG